MYDREQAFEKHLKQKAEELNELCKTLRICSFMSFCVKDDGKHSYYKNYIWGSSSNGIRLSENQISGHINVANGFDTVPPDESADLDDYYFSED